MTQSLTQKNNKAYSGGRKCKDSETKHTFWAFRIEEKGSARDDRHQCKCDAYLGGFIVLQLLQQALHRANVPKSQKPAQQAPIAPASAQTQNGEGRALGRRRNSRGGEVEDEAEEEAGEAIRR